MRYFLFDVIKELKLGETIKARKCVTLTDEVLHDHFPDIPIFPGALIIEGLAQVAGFLLETTHNQDASRPVRRAVLSTVDKMKFKIPSRPGDALDYFAKIDSLIDETAMLSVEARCGDEIRVQGRLMMTLLEVESNALTAQRLQIYKIWSRELQPCPILR
ncbi:MAG: 3-hydroxyacyl-ACP dehydratase FabZ family protein [Bacteriovoracia bacterium]